MRESPEKSVLQKLRVRLWVFFVLSLFALMTVSTSAWEAKSLIVTSLLFLVGMVLVGIASMGRLWCSLYIAGRKTRELVTEGPYSICRNPLYFFSWIGLTGVGLCSETLLVPALLAAGFALYYPGVIRDEEARMRELHGARFVDYLASTPRFFPRLFQLREPLEHVVNPRVFRRHLTDALLFVWCVGVLEMIEEAHKLGWLPQLLTIP